VQLCIGRYYKHYNSLYHFQCDLEYKAKLFAYDNVSLLLNTAHNIVLEFRNASNSPVCTKVLSLQEHGVYAMNITRKDVCPPLVATNVPDHIYERKFLGLRIQSQYLFLVSHYVSLFFFYFLAPSIPPPSLFPLSRGRVKQFFGTLIFS
jgi:hypothetical protein